MEKIMQPKKHSKKWNCDHYAAKPLFDRTLLVLLKNGQK